MQNSFEITPLSRLAGNIWITFCRKVATNLPENYVQEFLDEAKNCGRRRWDLKLISSWWELLTLNHLIINFFSYQGLVTKSSLFIPRFLNLPTWTSCEVLRSTSRRNWTSTWIPRSTRWPCSNSSRRTQRDFWRRSGNGAPGFIMWAPLSKLWWRSYCSSTVGTSRDRHATWTSSISDSVLLL